MTNKNSICIKCKHLFAFINGCCVTGNRKYLISQCEYGGKNAGNRKSCKRFEETDKKTIQKRFEQLGVEENGTAQNAK